MPRLFHLPGSAGSKVPDENLWLQYGFCACVQWAMRSWLLVVLGGCGFDLRLTAATGDAALDEEGLPISDGSPGTEPVAAFVCPTDAALRACYAFENTTSDGSSYRNDAVATSASYAIGHDGLGKALVTTAGTISVGNTTSLDIASFTIKLWIRANVLPTGGARAGLVDSGGRFRLFVQSGGALRCAITGGTDLTSGTNVVDANAWRRVACTFTGTQMRIYVDGTMVASSNVASTIPTTGGGMVIGHNNPSGENFNGAIDELQLWSSIVAP